MPILYEENIMSIVKVKNKKNGITYVYESNSYWDKEKKQPRNKRICIGKIDPKTNEIIYNKNYYYKQNQILIDKKYQRKFYGATYLFDKIVQKLNIDKDIFTNNTSD